MNHKIISALKYSFFLGLGIFLVWWQLGQMTELQKEQFISSLRNAHYLYLIPLIIMAILSHLSRAMRWNLLIEPMGYRPSASNSLYAILCGYFANTFVPRAGEIIRCTLLTRYEKIPFSKLIGTVIIERLFDLFSYGIIVAITILIQMNTVRQFLKEKLLSNSSGNNSSSIWLKLGMAILTGILLYFIIKWLLRRYEHLSIVGKLKQIQTGLKEGFLTIINLKKRKAFLGHTIFIWSMYLLQMYLALKVVPETEHLGIATAFSLLTLTTIAMMISPGGMGAFPIATHQVLLIYNVENISFGWLVWGLNTCLIIILGIISFGILIYQNKYRNEKKRYNPRTNIAPGGSSAPGNPVEA